MSEADCNYNVLKQKFILFVLLPPGRAGVASTARASDGRCTRSRSSTDSRSRPRWACRASRRRAGRGRSMPRLWWLDLPRPPRHPPRSCRSAHFRRDGRWLRSAWCCLWACSPCLLPRLRLSPSGCVPWHAPLCNAAGRVGSSSNCVLISRSRQALCGGSKVRMEFYEIEPGRMFPCAEDVQRNARG